MSSKIKISYANRFCYFIPLVFQELEVSLNSGICWENSRVFPRQESGAHTCSAVSVCPPSRWACGKQEGEDCWALLLCSNGVGSCFTPALQFLCALSQLFSVLQVPTPVRERGETSDFKAKETVSRKKYLPDTIVRRD